MGATSLVEKFSKYTCIIVIGILAILCFVFLTPLDIEEENLLQMHSQVNMASDAFEEAKEQAESIEQMEEYLHEDPKGRLVLYFPLKLSASDTMRITSAFNTYRGGSIQNQHNGVDLAVYGNPTNIDTLALVDSVVTKVAYQENGAGYYVKFKHVETGLEFIYMHMAPNSIVVKEGQHLKAGDKIGVMGTTGSSTGIHLHVGTMYPPDDGKYELTTVGSKKYLSVFDTRYFVWDANTIPFKIDKGDLTGEFETVDTKTENNIAKGQRADIVSYAMQWIGHPYEWGGTNLNTGVDCSGFTQQVYEHFGYTIPRNSQSQGDGGKAITKSQLQPGDLVFYHGENANGIGHVALYIGNGEIVHAMDTDHGICKSKIDYNEPIKYVCYIQ